MTTTTERPRSTTGSDFAALNKRVTKAGLLERKPAYYAVRLTAVSLMLIGGWTAFFLIGSSWWTLAVAAFLAVTFAQVALVAHDLAHRQVFRTKRPGEIAGRIAGNVAVGMSYGWWMDKHTRHHNNPNHDDLDPDVTPEVLIWATESALGRRGLKGFITRHQAGLFFPLLTLLGIDLKVSSVKALIRGDMKRRNLEAGLLIMHAVVYLTTLFVILSPLQAIAFLVVHQALFGVYLGMTFAPNHKGMPHPDGTEDYLRKQVLTSRNVTGGWLTDAALGGLNYQIEHHLFPAMPTPNLRKVQPIVEAYCAEIGVPYESTSLIESYRQALRHLNEVGAPLREQHKAAR
ncbi:fatty acid desaturase family protein [Actinoplanes friuliensis]|uniref:Putative fatty acid desaturase n=1 Tax=Actinoplanes friuliensis DSM 7358 TaxID=1246995 RepID=U5W847_9ACTN|nr:acyl-CoA desaturase [Actinoplanes friuliensis]AGZ45182.1 putative fatty acid desaturase [Actinoplanes friuliensis DSM 7358]